MTKKRSCFLCGADAAKGSHYLTVNTPDSTTRWNFAICVACGLGLSGAAKIFFEEFTKAWRAELEKVRGKAKND